MENLRVLLQENLNIDFVSAILSSPREKDGIKDGELETLFYQRTKGKCIMFVDMYVSVKMEKEEIEVIARASRKYMKVSIMKRAAITEPERRIRKWRLGYRDGT